MDRWTRWHLPALVIAMMVVVVLPLGFLYSVISGETESARRLEDARQVEASINALSYAIRDIESATLALAAGIDTPLVRARLHDSGLELDEQLKAVSALAGQSPAQQRRIGELRAVIAQRRQLTARIAESRNPEEMVHVAEETVTRFPVRDIAASIIAHEHDELGERSRNAGRMRERSVQLTWATMILQIALLGLLAWLLQRQLRQRLEVQRELQQASLRASAVMQTVREPIVLLDEAQDIVMHNTAFAELYTGDPRAELGGQALASIGEGAWNEPVILQRLNDVLYRDRELWDHEQRQRTSDDSERVMLLNARRMPLPDRDERVVLVTLSDVTAQKAIENQVRHLNRQLEGKVEQVSEVNRELEAFSYSVSHDLRAPLRHIAGFADKLGQRLGDSADEKSRHYLEVIGGSARRMAELIDDLLVYSRLGRSAMRLQPVDLQTLVSETRAMLDANLATDAPERRVEWRIAPLPILVGDENMLRQVWLNLLGNAVKYSDIRNPALIEVGHERQDDGSHHFSVRDNGAGFDMQYAGKLFGVFQRMHKASEYQGTGIGLASARRVVARHGGRIWAEAEPGAGATFHFTLPATLDNPSPEPRK
ncbi:ATP-binding protein [Lysobacter sp. GX 14042]|uniref:sensor histidine kinase n=1 Tax=Lysobacter sp. GX 14042 TaxID=2907155 RepID=UPI001F448774|nr:ATP-binding protein [Lysobacter sp. GX 14042]MCE7031874.1 ATP-binding protein [Lysobacter sp. GX 14042]